MVRRIARSTAKPHYVIPRSWFATRIVDFDLWLVCDGKIELVDVRGHSLVLGRGSVVWLAPGDVFEMRVLDHGPYTNVFVHFDLVDGAGKVIPHDEIKIPPTVGFVEDMHFFESTLQRIMFLDYQAGRVSRKTSAAINTLVSHLLKSLLFEFQLSKSLSDISVTSGIDQRHSQTVSSALSWLYLHPDSTLSAADLAGMFGYSQRHFCHLFRKITGKTPNQVLIEARIDHAKKLLTTSMLNVSEIAESLKYENVFYFSRQFKQLVGTPPAEFRRRHTMRFRSQ